MSKRKSKKPILKKSFRRSRVKGLKSSKAEVIIIGAAILLWILATLYDEGVFDKYLPDGLEDGIIGWGFIGACALYSVILLDRNPFVRHFFLWVYGLGFVALSVFRGTIVHWASWDWQDTTWLFISILKIACLFGFLHLAFLAINDYKKIRAGEWGKHQNTDLLPRII